MKIKILIIGALIISTLFSSCSKDEKQCQAGTGGAVTLVAFGKHHGKIVQPTSVRVKFNTQEFPGADSTAYDLNIAAEPGEDHIHIEDLKCGDYYIYMTGYDADIFEMVKGGIPYKIAEDKSGEIDIDIPITE